MRRFAIAMVLLSFGPTLPAVGQGTGASSEHTQSSQNSITLNEDQKQTVIDAAVSAKSRQKTPKEFSPSPGATVPKEVYLHGFKPDETKKVPSLKTYLYAFLDREIILVDGREMKVVAVVSLPEKLVAGEQPDQGAAEASSADAKGGTSPTGSVPSHTSPETIK